jgi:ribosomal protein L11 methyltransferase
MTHTAASLQPQPSPLVIAASLLQVGLLAALDYALTLRGVALPLYYLVPIVVSAWAAGWRLATAIGLLSALTNFAIDWRLAGLLANPLLVQLASALFFAFSLVVVRIASTLGLMLKFYRHSSQWRGQLPPSRLGQRLVVVPAGAAGTGPPAADDLPAPGLMALVMEPGQAFGTGSHPTTQLCAGLLETYVKAGDRVFDLGCGTGILALAAARLGAARVLGADINPEAVRVARVNAGLNHLADQVEFLLGGLDQVLEPDPTGPSRQLPFDLTVANILTSILIDSLRLGLSRTVAARGVLLLSGIKTAEVQQIRAALAAEQMEVVEERQSGGWVALAARWQNS